ncbi:helix-turn-helix transcriptional regulator [Methylobacterium brachiatum]|uniref:helix-turn-helix transcriptional regulator n=1 Tax=Methylobacterium brachiatum TaxID=269660 RepID=UPI00244AA3EB|nr:LuxR family transcriptional regulator [Methylobacterium brachiatum]MDH2310314.1 LuxR family transcriptional regulator [Methylobacterium brachiatum]
MSSTKTLAFDIIGKIRDAKSFIGIANILRDHGSTFGYEAFSLGSVPQSSKQTMPDCVVISGWPPEWEGHYHARGHIRFDPVLRYMRRVIDPFHWREAADFVATPAARTVLDEAREFRLNDGFCVPIHRPDGSEAGVSFGGEQMRLSPDESAALHLIGIYAVSAARAISRAQAEPLGPARPGVRLTDRETECLRWSAAGKTAWETSVILSISRRTVEQHLASACQKLNAVGRVQGVAEAIRCGLID